MMLIECAYGRFPFPAEDEPQQDLGFWDLMQFITLHPSPEPPASYSQDFRDFVAICMRKQGGTRSSCTELLQHPFCKKHAAIE